MFNIIKNRKIFYLISAVIILAGIVMAFVNGGFNQDVDFKGGTSMNIVIGQPFDNNEIASIASEAVGFNVSSVQKVGTDGTQVQIKTTELSQDQRVAMYQAIKDHYQLEAESPISVDSVSPTIGDSMKNTALWAALIAAALMLIYISIRFELFSGIAAVMALIHDVLIMLAVYIIFKIPINTSFIAALLTILGYSINATIILFDRIRENTRLSRKDPFETITNNSIWQTMGRSINTTITTLATLVILYFLGVSSIKEFAFPIIIGMLSGTYSSVFLAGNFWIWLKKLRKDKNVVAA